MHCSRRTSATGISGKVLIYLFQFFQVIPFPSIGQALAFLGGLTEILLSLLLNTNFTCFFLNMSVEDIIIRVYLSWSK